MNAIRNFFKDKTVGFYLAFAAAAVALVADLIFVATDAADRTFSVITFLFILFGVACQALASIKDWFFLPILPAACYGVALGMHLYLGLATLSDIWNGVNFIGGNPAAAVAFSAIFGLCTLAAAAACFLPQRKAAF
jgi:hypothetical protein